MKRGYGRFLGNIQKCINLTGMLFLKYLLSKKYICENLFVFEKSALDRPNAHYS